MELHQLSITQLKEKLKRGEVSEEEIEKAFQKRINDVEENIKAYINVNDKKESKESTTGDLSGIPLAIKDNISTKGMETTCASQILSGYTPPYNATVINRLKKEGASIIGKTNMDEFAMGSSTENSNFYPTRNPWDIDCVPGGSSGGSAAAVAAGEAPGALGSDTGGSIRQPAAFCGVVGMKPTYGLVSRYGLVAFASSLDQIGPITRDVEDAALLMNAISGHDPKDSTSINRELPDYNEYIKEDVSDLKIGIPQDYFELDMDNEVKESVLNGVKKLEEAGAEVDEVDLISAEYALAAYYIIAPAEASSNLARYDGVRYGFRSDQAEDIETMFTNTRSEGFGDEVKRRIMLGTYVLSSGYYDDYYLQAQKTRTLIKNEFDRVFKDYDMLISPTTPTTSFKLNDKKDPIDMYHSDIFTVPVNIAGIPAISIPCGFDSNNLPIGLQIMGPQFGEGKILQAAYTLEQILDLDLKPKL